MRGLRRQDLVVVEAVARHLVVPWQKAAGDWPGATLKIAGKHIALEIATIEAAGASVPAKIRLRFDKEVMRLVDALQAGLGEAVPDREAVIVTVTAPIRQGSKAAAALVRLIGDALTRPVAAADIVDTIQGNQVRIRRVQGVAGCGPNVIGFVHNPDSDVETLLAITQCLQQIGAAADRRQPKTFAGERWLAIADEAGIAPTETYRQIRAAGAIPADFKKIFIVRREGRVAALDGEALPRPPQPIAKELP